MRYANYGEFVESYWGRSIAHFSLHRALPDQILVQFPSPVATNEVEYIYLLLIISIVGIPIRHVRLFVSVGSFVEVFVSVFGSGFSGRWASGGSAVSGWPCTRLAEVAHYDRFYQLINQSANRCIYLSFFIICIIL